jgi:transcription elongation factor Elf1
VIVMRMVFLVKGKKRNEMYTVERFIHIVRLTCPRCGKQRAVIVASIFCDDGVKTCQVCIDHEEAWSSWLWHENQGCLDFGEDVPF